MSCFEYICSQCHFTLKDFPPEFVPSCCTPPTLIVNPPRHRCPAPSIPFNSYEIYLPSIEFLYTSRCESNNFPFPSAFSTQKNFFPLFSGLPLS